MKAKHTQYTLLDLQKRFASVVLSPDRHDAIVHSQSLPIANEQLWRFSIYRSHYANVSAQCLATTYPLVQKALGSEKFYNLCVLFARTCPSQQAALYQYGKEFSLFLSQHYKRLHFPAWASELAKMEWGVQESYFSEDAPIFDSKELSMIAQDPDQALSYIFCLHPASRLFKLEYNGLHYFGENKTTSEASNRTTYAYDLLQPGSENILVTRNSDGVSRYLLDDGESAFLQACNHQNSLEVSLEKALKVDPKFDLGLCLGQNALRGTFQLPYK